MQEGDLLLVVRKVDGNILMIAVQGGSTIENQLLWLFGIVEVDRQFVRRDYEDEREDIPLNFASRIIIEELGIEVEVPTIICCTLYYPALAASSPRQLNSRPLPDSWSGPHHLMTLTTCS